MIQYDMHIHTEYCGHAEGMTTEAIITRAGQLGLETIAITDHVFSPDSLPRIEKIRHEVQQIPHPCQVIVGAEVDIDPMHTDGRFVTEDIEHLDYIIAGLHYIPTVGKYAHSPDDHTLDPQELFSHWRTTLLGIVSNPLVSTLAHPGRMIGTAVSLDDWWAKILEVFEEAAPVSAKNRVAWELNELSGSKVDERYHDRWHRIYEIGLSEGVKLLFGSDAHLPEHVGRQDFVQFLLGKLPKGALASPQEIGVAKT